MRYSISLLVALAVLGPLAAFPQSAATPAPHPPPRPIVIQTAQPQTRPDPFVNLINSAASFDMDSPVEAHAEFEPPVAAAGESVIYRVTVTALDESLQVPKEFPLPEGLKLQPGGRGQIYKPSGGMKVRPFTSINFHAVAASNGTFTVPAFSGLAYGKSFDIPEATLKVVDAADVPPYELPRVYVQPPPGDIYIGQSLAVSLAIPVVPKMPLIGMTQSRLSGDFIFSESSQATLHPETVQRDGRELAANGQEVLATPLREGPIEVIGQTFGLFVRPPAVPGGITETVYELLDSGVVTIEVKPLPKEGVLPGFNGAVGVLQIEPPRLSSNVVTAGDPVVLTVGIRGAGNLSRLTPPSPPTVPDWQTFPATGMLPGYVQQRGYVAFTYTFIPLSDKITKTPPIPFSTFDPASKRYLDLTIPSVPITVKRPTNAPAAVAAAPPPEASTKPKDEAPAQEPDLALTGLVAQPGFSAGVLVPLQQRWWFGALQLIPAAMLAGLWFRDRRRRHLSLHPEILRKRRARRGLRRQLRLALRAASARDAAAFVRGAAAALREGCAPYGAANPNALVCADVLEGLPAAQRTGQPGELVRRLFAAADAAEFGGPANEAAELLAQRTEVESVIDDVKSRL